MVVDGVEFHNVGELRALPGQAGKRLQRVPEAVRVHLNERAQQRMLSPAGSEIRFVSRGERVRVTLSCPEGTAELFPFWGPFQGRQRFAIGREPQTLELSYPERLAMLEPGAREGLLFSPGVWRLTLRGDSLHYHTIEGDGLRPPNREEVPGRRYLSYGTSITHGSAATAMHLTYVSQTAWRLGADLINLGVGGSAYCESELADYIAGREDWDICTLALSVNMVGGFTVEAFAERVSTMVNTIAGANTDRPVVCITIYPHFRDFCTDAHGPEGREKTEAFRGVLWEVVQACPHPNVHLIEGPDLLANIGGLTVDLIHPGDHGMIQMGERLGKRLCDILGM